MARSAFYVSESCSAANGDTQGSVGLFVTQSNGTQNVGRFWGTGVTGRGGGEIEIGKVGDQCIGVESSECQRASAGQATV